MDLSGAPGAKWHVDSESNKDKKIELTEVRETKSGHVYNVAINVLDFNSMYWSGIEIVSGDFELTKIGWNGNIIVRYNLASLIPESLTINDEIYPYETVLKFTDKGEVIGLLNATSKGEAEVIIQMVTHFGDTTFSGFIANKNWQTEVRIFSLSAGKKEEFGRFESRVKAIVIENNDFKILME